MLRRMEASLLPAGGAREEQWDYHSREQGRGGLFNQGHGAFGILNLRLRGFPKHTWGWGAGCGCALPSSLQFWHSRTALAPISGGPRGSLKVLQCHTHRGCRRELQAWGLIFPPHNIPPLSPPPTSPGEMEVREVAVPRCLLPRQ